MRKDGKRRVWQKRETAKKWERVPVQLYDSSVGLVRRALQWPSKCCWNENHISTADFLPHITSPLAAPALLSQTPSSLPEGLCRSGLATVWFSLVNYKIWSCPCFWNTLLSYFCSFFFLSEVSVHSAWYHLPFSFFPLWISLCIKAQPVTHHSMLWTQCSPLYSSSHYDNLLSNCQFKFDVFLRQDKSISESIFQE